VMASEAADADCCRFKLAVIHFNNVVASGIIQIRS
jgi:hypothetical protein